MDLHGATLIPSSHFGIFFVPLYSQINITLGLTGFDIRARCYVSMPSLVIMLVKLNRKS